MNEVIGARGGSNDRRKYFIKKSKFKRIKRRYLEQKKKKLEELEKIVKKKQIITFIKAMSIIIPLGTIDIIVKNASNKTQTKSTIIHKNSNVKNNIMTEEEKKHHLKTLSSIRIVNEEKKLKKIDNNIAENKEEHQNINREKIKFSINQIRYKNEGDIKKNHKNIHDDKKESQDRPENKKEQVIPTISKIRDKKIIGYYEEQFKEKRTEIKEITYEYDKLRKKNLEMHDVRELEKLKDNLNLLIERLEDLEKKVYDGEIPDDYFYNFIDDYIRKFKNREQIDMVKDSKLFIMISEELAMVEEVLNEKKEHITLIYDNLSLVDPDDEPNLDREEGEYFSFDKFNKELTKFQDKQVKIIDYIEKNMPEVESLNKKIRIKMGLMNLECALLFPFILTSAMKRPSIRTAKAMAISTLVSVYFMNQIMKDKYNKENIRQKELKREEYQKEIEHSIASIDDVTVLVYRTIGEVDRLINEIKKEYQDYSDSKEYSELLENLFTIKHELSEKEYELIKIKEKETKLARKNVKEYEKIKNKTEN